jgi:hypothetical protein
MQSQNKEIGRCFSSAGARKTAIISVKITRRGGGSEVPTGKIAIPAEQVILPLPTAANMFRKFIMPRETYTAHHEAGHAVIGHVLGLVCGSVTVVPDAVGFGCATIKNRWPHSTHGKFGADAVTNAAILDRSIVPASWH